MTQDQIAGRVNQIRAEIEKSDSDYDREAPGAPRQAGRRRGRHQGRRGHRGRAQGERKHRIEDAVRNAKAAVEEGIVAGGGVALVRRRPPRSTSSSSSVTRPWSEHRARGDRGPLKQIAVNAGLGAASWRKVKNLESGHGLSAATGEYVDMIAGASSTPPR